MAWKFVFLELKRLEDRCVPSAVRAGFDDTSLPPSDDGSSKLIHIGFSLNYFGITRDALFINNNGNVTLDEPLRAFTPFPLTSTEQEIIAPFFSDVDTRPEQGGTVSYGTHQIDGHLAFGVTWEGVGYYRHQVDKLNTFQVVLIDRSDTGEGNFDLEFNYDQIQWETGNSSGGTNGLGGNSARVGYSNGSGNPGTFFELEGSALSGAFLDDDTITGLIHNSRNADVQGRYVFSARDGTIAENNPPTLQAINDQTIQEGTVLQVQAFASDPNGDNLTFSLTNAPDGATMNAATGELTWTASDGPAEYTFIVRATDGGSPAEFVEETFKVNVTNVAPMVQAGEDQTLDEGDTIVLQGSFIDPGEDTHTLSWEVIDSSDTVVASGSGNTLEFTPADNGTYIATFSVTDDDEDTGNDSLTLTVNNVEPTVEAGEDQTLDEGDTVVLQGGFTDPGDHSHTLSWEVIDSSETVVASGSGAILEFTPADDGIYFATFTVTDDDEATGSASLMLTVNNVAPSVLLDPRDVPFIAQGTFVGSGSFSDPGMENRIATVDFGDGAGPQSLELNADQTFNLIQEYTSEGRFTLTVTIDDGVALTQDSLEIIVLPAQSNNKVGNFKLLSINPGEQVSVGLEEAPLEVTALLDVKRDANAAGASTVFFAFYKEAPVETDRIGIFFDIQANLSAGDEIALTFNSSLIMGPFEFGFFDPDNPGTWISLLDAVDLAEIEIDESTGTMTVQFNTLSIFGGTVFTVSLPQTSASRTVASSSVVPNAASVSSTSFSTANLPTSTSETSTTTSTVTTNIQPSVAVSSTNTPTTTDASSGLTRQATFTSNTQLSLALTAARDTQLGTNGMLRGSPSSFSNQNNANNQASGSESRPALRTTGLGGGSGPGGPDENAMSQAWDQGYALFLTEEEWLLLQQHQEETNSPHLDALWELWSQGVDLELLLTEEEWLYLEERARASEKAQTPTTQAPAKPSENPSTAEKTSQTLEKQPRHKLTIRGEQARKPLIPSAKYARLTSRARTMHKGQSLDLAVLPDSDVRSVRGNLKSSISEHPESNTPQPTPDQE